MFNDPTPGDWVEQRAKCTAADMYERLRDIVRQDVEAADKHVPGNSDFNFKAEGEFVASRADPGPADEWPVFVRFALTGVARVSPPSTPRQNRSRWRGRCSPPTAAVACWRSRAVGG